MERIGLSAHARAAQRTVLTYAVFPAAAVAFNIFFHSCWPCITASRRFTRRQLRALLGQRRQI
jgi:hypothetical protein